MPRARTRAQQLEDLRLHADVERRRRFVGQQQLRPAHQRDRERHALTHAAGQFVRILPQARAPARGSRPRAAIRSARARASARVARPRSSSPSTSWVSMRKCGVSELMRILRQQRHADAAHAVQCASRSHRATRGRRTSPNRRAAVARRAARGTPAATASCRSPIRRRPRGTRRGARRATTSATARTVAAFRREIDAEVVDLAAATPRVACQRCLGSSASRRPSPMKFRQTSSAASTADGTSSSHGALSISSAPSATSRPEARQRLLHAETRGNSGNSRTG